MKNLKQRSDARKDLRLLADDIANNHFLAHRSNNTPDQRAEYEMALAHQIEELESLLQVFKKDC